MKPIKIGSLKSQTPCEFCDALLWPTETSQICCKKGSLFDKDRPFESPLQFLPDPPQEILHLINTPTLARHLSHYNNALAMASIGGDFPENNATTRLQGRMYHSLGSLAAPATGERPKFASIYFHDPEHEEEHRMAHLSRTHLRPEILRALQNLLSQINGYLVSFKAAIEIYGDHDNVKIVILSTPAKKSQHNIHPGCYSLPQGSEVITSFLAHIAMCFTIRWLLSYLESPVKRWTSSCTFAKVESSKSVPAIAHMIPWPTCSSTPMGKTVGTLG